jgi:hypothetical protein
MVVSEVDMDQSEWTMHQTLAWMCWRNEQAVRAFAGERETVVALWKQALDGRYPIRLRAPRFMAPAEAERQLSEAVRSGKLTAYVRPVPH